jgi:hypothetical protein
MVGCRPTPDPAVPNRLAKEGLDNGNGVHCMFVEVRGLGVVYIFRSSLALPILK